MLRVDAARLRSDFDALASIGGTAEGGVDRPTFSEAHLDARAWFLERAAAAGLETRLDTAGNHSAVLRSRVARAPTLLLGSPRGGRDRLLAGLESVGLEEERLGDARREPATLAGYLELHIEQGPVL